VAQQALGRARDVRPRPLRQPKRMVSTPPTVPCYEPRAPSLTDRCDSRQEFNRKKKRELEQARFAGAIPRTRAGRSQRRDWRQGGRTNDHCSVRFLGKKYKEMPWVRSGRRVRNCDRSVRLSPPWGHFLENVNFLHDDLVSLRQSSKKSAGTARDVSDLATPTHLRGSVGSTPGSLSSSSWCRNRRFVRMGHVAPAVFPTLAPFSYTKPVLYSEGRSRNKGARAAAPIFHPAFPPLSEGLAQRQASFAVGLGL